MILLQASKAVICSGCALVVTKKKHLIQPLSSGMIEVNLALHQKTKERYLFAITFGQFSFMMNQQFFYHQLW